MQNHLLIINAGSSSIKFTLYRLTASENLLVSARGEIDGIGINPSFSVTNGNAEPLSVPTATLQTANDHAQAMTLIQAWLQDYLTQGNLLAVGHRVVHGGSQYSAPVRVDTQILQTLEALVSLAPLHQPHNLHPIRSLLKSNPHLPQIACFDTAFHSTQPTVAKQIAIPRAYTEAGICRYGFHGLSYEYIANSIPILAPELQQAKIVVAHLGNGASMCAMHQGVSVATTMGFSPLDGLVMGTRCGNIDPGVLLHLLQNYALDAAALEKLLYHQSGLLGVSGISSDMRILLEHTDPQAQQAIELFVYRIGRELGSLAAALGGIDALIFTGGIGEHAIRIREQIGHIAAWLGLEIDTAANQQHAVRISTSNSQISAWVIPTDENLMIARHTLHLVQKTKKYSIPLG